MELSVLVTGGLGFVGSAIVAAIQELHPEWTISILDLHMPDKPQSYVAYHVCDITDRAQTEEVMSKIKPTAVIHTAGVVPGRGERYSRNHEERFFRINVDGTRNVLIAAKSSNVKAFVWTGSLCAVTDDLERQFPNIDESCPTSNRSLAAAETLVLAASSTDMLTCSLRPSIIFGPGDPAIISSLHACIANKETSFIIGDGLNLWDLTYLSNVADAHVLAVQNLLSTRTAAGQAISISNEQPLPFRHFCLAVWKEFGHFPPLEIRIPVRLAVFAGYFSDWTTWLLNGPPSVLSRGSVKDACHIRYCSGAKAREVLGYRPRVGIEEGIRVSCRDFMLQRPQELPYPVELEKM
ncbi:MAG: hypothetical protein LQ350_004525 [Teloschistes chrysophthalmus]|nr:MAG: hypothetical protein LQ350_004525 [Niorma chrysophthalma]